LRDPIVERAVGIRPRLAFADRKTGRWLAGNRPSAAGDRSSATGEPVVGDRQMGCRKE
jgi:hypothetical protein